MHKNRTIFALSTPLSKSAISIIRISGPKSLRALVHFRCNEDIKKRTPCLRKIYDHSTLELIDEAIVIFFPKENSYTGEDLLELHLHGSIAIIKKVLSDLSEIQDFHMANAGEFTRKALENGKISLIKTESLMDLINSETEFQRKVASRNYDGALEDMYKDWSSDMISILASLEAYIDFPDDMLDEKSIKSVNASIASFEKKLQGYLTLFKRCNSLLDGAHVSIIGTVNVGKSTLMNLISQNDTSIISSVEGTTRDVVRDKIEINGLPVILSDTAGIRDTENPVERIGITKSRGLAKDSDILIIVLDCSLPIEKGFFYDLVDMELSNKPIILINKIDLNKEYDLFKKQLIDFLKAINFQYSNIVNLSLIDEKSYNKFIKILEIHLSKLSMQLSNSGFVIGNMRQCESIQSSIYYLQNALGADMIDLKAQELRFACAELGALIGNIALESVLDKLFSKFCIGK